VIVEWHGRKEEPLAATLFRRCDTDVTFKRGDPPKSRLGITYIVEISTTEVVA
jgi:hypothetical protein